MSDHGRIIPLTPEPHQRERHIEVFAGYADPGEDVSREVESRLTGIRERSREDSVEVRSRSAAVVSKQRAERVVVRYYDTKLDRWSMEDFIEIFRNGVAYSLYLRTAESSYPRDRTIFDELVRSFVFRR